MYDIIHWNRGRLGNSLFRYFASIVISLKSPLHKYSDVKHNNDSIVAINDAMFLQIVKNMAVPSANIHLSGYYQYQELAEYKEHILRYIKTNSQDTLHTDRNETFIVGDLMNTNVPVYEYVIHIRLEDFVDIHEFIPVDVLIQALRDIPLNGIVAIVMNKAKTEFEKEYLNKILEYLSSRKIYPKIESNSIKEDFAIMRNCKNLICSKSTISWCAAFLSERMEICYMPDYTIFREHQTMKMPHKHTVLYTISLAS